MKAWRHAPLSGNRTNHRSDPKTSRWEPWMPMSSPLGLTTNILRMRNELFCRYVFAYVFAYVEVHSRCGKADAATRGRK